jgi:hypothetical protein
MLNDLTEPTFFTFSVPLAGKLFTKNLLPCQ